MPELDVDLLACSFATGPSSSTIGLVDLSGDAVRAACIEAGEALPMLVLLFFPLTLAFAISSGRFAASLCRLALSLANRSLIISASFSGGWKELAGLGKS